MHDDYANPKYYANRQVTIAGTGGKLTLTGTAASSSVLARWLALTNMRIIGCSALVLTGGTAAAGPVLALQRSVGGTGTATTFATYAFNTHADMSRVNFTVPASTLNSGDSLLVTLLAGTHASTPVVVLELLWREAFV